MAENPIESRLGRPPISGQPAIEETSRSLPALAIVVPCYNEEDVLPETIRRLAQLIDQMTASGSIGAGAVYFVDDGSKDATWQIIEGAAATSPQMHGVKLSRNHGHQKALLAGLLSIPGDVLISIDADLQDDLDAMHGMLAAYAAGAEIVYGVRGQRTTDTRFKRVTAEAYYSVLRRLGVRLIFNHADYRLMSRRVIEVLREYKESNIFLRGLVPQLGFNSALVYYDRQVRFAGRSKYPFSKMFGLALEGITSFSDVPLKIITVVGLLISLGSFGMVLWAFWVRVVAKEAIPGWASTVIPMYMLGGVQLLCVGMVGQYVAKIYAETKSRPRFIIEKML